MRAAVYDRRGPAREVLRVEDRPDPEPGAGEVRVRIGYSAVNPTDIKARSDWLGQSQMLFPLAIPHRDAGGIIDKVGEGVDHARVGERVWINLNHRTHPFGTAAEYTTVPQDQAWRLPETTSLAEGACLAIPAMTAYCALYRDGPLVGRTVLVQGGAGAVGFYSVQLAKLAGAGRVIATVSREAQAQRAREAGADAVVNYRDEDAVAQIAAAAGGPSRVDHIVEVNFAANIALDTAVIAPGGRIIAYASDSDPNPTTPFYLLMQKDVLVRMFMVTFVPRELREAAAAEIVRLLDAGRLRHQIAGVFPLDDIVAAHELQETGRPIGKVLVKIADLE